MFIYAFYHHVGLHINPFFLNAAVNVSEIALPCMATIMGKASKRITLTPSSA
jgi:hypothetical protein